MRLREVVAGAIAVVHLLVWDASPARAREEVPRAFAVRAAEDQLPRAEALRRAVLDEYRLRGSEVAEPSAPEAGPELGGALEEATAAYAHLRPAEALRLVDGVIASFEAGGGAGLDREGYLRALLLRALAALALGLGAEADRALSTVLAVDPSIALDAAEYPPSLLERLGALRETFPAEPGALRIDSDPPSAEVWVDGVRLESRAPRLLLPPGRHVLRFDAPLRAAQARSVVVSAGEAAALSVRLEPSAHEALGGPVPEDAPERLLSGLARGLGAALVLVDLRAAPEGLLVRARDTRSGRVARVSMRPNEPSAAVARRLVALLLVPAVARDDAGARRKRRIRLGASVGAAGVAAGVAAALVGIYARRVEGFEGQWSR